MRTRALAALALAAACCAAPPAARATQTDPVLLIAAARALAAPGGTLVEIDAAFPEEDLVQRAIAVQVLLRAHAGGTAFVRFELGGGAVAGTLGALSNGLDAGDVPTLLTRGAPLAGARLLRMARQRIELWLPAATPFAVGHAQIFLVYEGDPILSNPAPVEELAP